MDIQKLIDDYATWLKQEITFEKVGEYYEITTPYFCLLYTSRNQYQNSTLIDTVLCRA